MHAFRVRAAVLFMVLRIVLMLLRVAMLLPVVFFMQTQRRVMLRTFMRRIRFRLGPIRCPAFFHFRGFFLGQLRNFRGVRCFCFGFGSLSFRLALRFFFGLFLGFFRFSLFRLFLFKNRAARPRVDARFFLHFFLLGFHDSRSQSRDLILA